MNTSRVLVDNNQSAHRAENIDAQSMSLTKLAGDLYTAHSVSATLCFKDSILRASHDIYANNMADPDGYCASFDAMLDGVLKALPSDHDRAGYARLAEATKRRYMLQISANAIRDSVCASERAIHDIEHLSLEQVGISAALSQDTDQYISATGRDGIRRSFSQVVDCMSVHDNTGQLIITEQHAEEYSKMFNRAVRESTIRALLDDCRTVEDAQSVRSRFLADSISAEQCGIVHVSGVYEPKYFGMLPIKHDPSDHHVCQLDRMIDQRERDILCADTTSRQVRSLTNVLPAQRLLGVTRCSSDQWFEMHRSEYISGTPEQQYEMVKRLALRMDRVPSQMVETISGAVRSGDHAAIQVAVPIVTGWHDINSAALYRAFRDDESSLLHMFTLADGCSTAHTTDTGVRARALKSIDSGNIRTAEERDYYDRRAAEYANSEWISSMISEWRNNGARHNLLAKEDIDNSSHCVSDLALADIREQFVTDLYECGGNLSAARRMAETRISAVGISYLCGSIMMPYLPEWYQGIPEHADELRSLLESRAKAVWYDTIPSGAEYHSTELLSDDETRASDARLQDALSAGIDFIVEDGKKTRSPSYLHLAHYMYGGVLHTAVCGRVNPGAEVYRDNGTY